MDKKEKSKKKKDPKKSDDEWKAKPVKKRLQNKTKVKHPKSWYQEEEE